MTLSTPSISRIWWVTQQFVLAPPTCSSRVEDDVEVGQLGWVEDPVNVVDSSVAQRERERAVRTST
jgi:hypothetical protein